MGFFKEVFGEYCDHDYDLIDKEIKESPLKEMLNAGVCISRTTKWEILTTKTVSRVFKCKKCNKVWIDNVKM